MSDRQDGGAADIVQPWTAWSTLRGLHSPADFPAPGIGGRSAPGSTW